MFRFTIRDVLWLTVVVALVVGWWLEHRSQTARIEALDKEVRHLRQQPWITDVDVDDNVWIDLTIADPALFTGNAARVNPAGKAAAGVAD
jgi:hypothetical protein